MTASERAKYQLDKFVGKAKRGVGQATGDRRLRNEGRVDEITARARIQGNKVKDTLLGRRNRRRPRAE
ncbi:MAG: CsbD family protein [Mycobacterium sp.]